MELESVKNDETVQPEAPAVEIAPQVNTPVSEVAVQPAPSKPAKKKGSLSAILIGLLIFLLIIGIAGLGYKGYTLNRDLTAAQAHLVDLQGKHDALKTENEKLTTDIAQAKADTETAKSDTKSSQGKLTDLQNKAKLVQTNIASAGLYALILDSVFVKNDSDLVIALEVLITGDSKLYDLFQAAVKNPTNENLDIFVGYIFEKIDANLKK